MLVFDLSTRFSRLPDAKCSLSTSFLSNSRMKCSFLSLNVQFSKLPMGFRFYCRFCVWLIFQDFFWLQKSFVVRGAVSAVVCFNSHGSGVSLRVLSCAPPRLRFRQNLQSYCVCVITRAWSREINSCTGHCIMSSIHQALHPDLSMWSPQYINIFVNFNTSNIAHSHAKEESIRSPVRRESDDLNTDTLAFVHYCVYAHIQCMAII